MPYRIEANDDGTYRVVNSDTGDVKAKSTTKDDAEKQIRLLQGTVHEPRRHRFGH